jgi:ABC-type transport system involved in multi-copper enzyme maturation permease subunit
MRHVAAFRILLGYVLVLAIILLAIQTGYTRQNPGSPPSLVGPQIGRVYWLAGTLIQIMALGLVAMVLGASAFALEREQRTSEALLLTRLSPAAVLLGKWIASYAALALLVFSAVPLLAVTFIFGGVAPAEIARSTALILASAAGFLGIGILCSARSRRSITAMVHAALVTGLLLFGIPFIGIFRDAVFRLSFGPDWALFRPMILLNPLLATLNLFEPIRPLTPSVSDLCILFYLILALVCCLAAWVRLVREARSS